jgi:hypothetical protein
MPVPAATPASAFFAPDSLRAKLFVNYRLILTRGKPGAAGMFLDGSTIQAPD